MELAHVPHHPRLSCRISKLLGVEQNTQTRKEGSMEGRVTNREITKTNGTEIPAHNVVLELQPVGVG
jgi:hypothetical protein